jgi:RNA polymerase sigma-70 factor (ECF subfamily)
MPMAAKVHSDEITRLLLEMREGNPEAAPNLIPLVYDQLRRTARSLLRNERGDHTLQPTALVNDALMRLIGKECLEWQSRAQFFAVSSKIMRHILIDHARAHGADKRGGEFQKISLDHVFAYEWRQADSFLSLNEALDRLQEFDPRLCSVVEMRFFAGMTEEEISDVLKVSVRTVKRDWQFARDWLYREMTRPGIAFDRKPD